MVEGLFNGDFKGATVSLENKRNNIIMHSIFVYKYIKQRENKIADCVGESR
jgi:hypothetical protein